ncbi:hypothetical protein KZ829_17740 [Actinoplanes hulinensis]|uniref:Haloacid dehalogenase-like hydrolase n=1 Tax=Actinoplanes hulinensis TaxID=1144547 RepID=A0ABS7B3H0_9ACTN|nr:hypothetical protein [Actinoplanes hulinensis]MBW6435586.1 hypothetical protein [Actinoplanes hulinensis]
MTLLLVDLDNTLIDRDAAFREAAGAFLAAHGLPAGDLSWLMGVDASGYTPRGEVGTAMVNRYGVPGAAVRALLDTGGADRVVLVPAIADALTAVRPPAGPA